MSRLELFPITTRITDDRLTIAGCSLHDLAERYGTPLYLYDQATLEDAVERYRAALRAHYPAPAGLTYAGKAYLSLAMAQWVQERGLWLDCTGAGELAIAAAAKVPPASVLVHGVNKSETDLRAVLRHAGTLVADNLPEVHRLLALARAGNALPELWLRLRPGIAVATHAHIQTGQEDSKFGMSREEAAEAVRLCLENGLPLTGLHFHQGSHFHEPEPLRAALDGLLDFAAAMRSAHGWLPRHVSPGGGWGTAYHEEALPHPPVEVYVQLIGEHLQAGCRARALPLPHLHLEPGRSIVARAGVAVYRVGTVKHTASRRWLLLDGGLADNPRPALYGARYSALPVRCPERPPVGPAWLGGPYCESGDVLIEALPLPEIRAGELIAVPVSGAYQLSMGSNYNGARKPAVLWLREGQARLIQRRETPEDLLRRDVPLGGK
ncbi:MAG TPA: diaminopimelate decarboxylase [Chloroflexi bacterium]|nr:diaminopimelate decarboxylase [Chloroflexota bacterium]